MNRLIIVYDLRTKNKENYPDLYKWFEANKAIGINESVYLVKTNKTVEVVFDELNKLTDKEDDLVVNIFPYNSISKNSKREEWSSK